MRDLPTGVYRVKEAFKALSWDSTRKVKHLGTFSTAEEAEYVRNTVMNGHHWIGKEIPEDCWGFTYLITNKTNGKKYIGKKQLRLWNGPPGGYKCTDPRDEEWFSPEAWRPNDWEFYTGSSNKLNADIKDLGVYMFTFEVLDVCYNKLDLHLSEVLAQMERDVLEAVDEAGNYIYYNENIAGLEFRAPFVKAEMLEAMGKTIEDAQRYYLRPNICNGCGKIIPYKGECECV